jgi:hypothetical protein
MRAHEFPANARVRAHAITADFGSKLIRNQQVTRSGRVAGSSLLLPRLTNVSVRARNFTLTRRIAPGTGILEHEIANPSRAGVT